MPTRHPKHRQPQRSGWLLGLLLSLPASAIELHLDAVALQVPAFILPADRPLLGLQQWQLAGVFHSNQAQRSLALISIDGHAPLAVQVGEVIAQSIQLQAVYADHILLRRGDSSAQLFLQQGLAVTPASAGATPAERLTTPPLSADCAHFSESRVPQEELITLGICPPASG
jgi:hypothetical protein